MIKHVYLAPHVLQSSTNELSYAILVCFVELDVL
jgi:hypothetical protein